MSFLHALEKLAGHAASAGAGAATGLAGSIGGVLGADPQRQTVPAYTYGKQNPSFGAAFNIASKPGSMVARGENATVGALQALLGRNSAPAMLPMAHAAHKLMPTNLRPMQPMGYRQAAHPLAVAPHQNMGPMPNLGVSSSPLQGGFGMQPQDVGGMPTDIQPHQLSPVFRPQQPTFNPQVKDNGYYWNN